MRKSSHTDYARVFTIVVWPLGVNASLRRPVAAYSDGIARSRIQADGLAWAGSYQAGYVPVLPVRYQRYPLDLEFYSKQCKQPEARERD